jgi:DNA-binding NarL/FixJ family response regulator
VAIEATSRSALTEMRRLLGVLRQEGQTRGSLSAAPGLADLDSLVSQVQDAGLRVCVRVDGQRGTIPPGIDLSAYRIIQEALTNVIKHAHCPAAEATRLICGSEEAEGVKVLVLTTFDLDEYVYAALRAGASGFLLKDTPPNDLLAGIRVVAPRPTSAAC